MSTNHRTTRFFRPVIRPLVVALALTGLPALTLTAASTSPATATTCSATTAHWGSQPRSLSWMTPDPVTNVRAGRQACFDRMVIDIRGRGAGYNVRYVRQVVTEGKGAVVPLRGGARLAVSVKAPAYDLSTGRLTYHPANWRELVNVRGYSTFRQIAWGGTFEGYTTVGLGVRARLPMRVFILNGPGTGSRIVVDVAHHW